MGLLAITSQLQAANSKDEQYRWAALNESPPRQYLGPAGQLRFFGTLANRICGYFWPAQNPKGVVILVHGQGSYLTFEYLKHQGVGVPKVYDGSWVQQLNAAGFSVAGIDNRGCGRSSGLFGYIEHHQIWIDNLIQFTQEVQSSEVPGFAGLPIFLLGSSLGGCLALHAVLAKPSLYQGLILLAPMISLERVKRKGLNPILLRVAAILNWFVPTWPLVRTNVNNMFPELQADFDINPCTYTFSTRVRIGVECLRLCDRLSGTMQQLQAPLLVVHSTKDDMTDPDGSKMLVERAKSTDKTLKLVDNMWHVLTKEPGNQELLQDCITWLTARLPGAAAAAAAATGACCGSGQGVGSSSSETEGPGSTAASTAGDSWEKVDREEAAAAAAAAAVN